MVRIGNDNLPGPITDVKSANYVGIVGVAPQDVALVGPADFGAGVDQGSGVPDTVYYIVSVSQADEIFGANSMMAEQVRLALGNGSQPLFCVAPAQTSVTGESGGTSATGTLANAPLPERTDHLSVTADGTAMTPRIVYNSPPSGADVAAGEVAINPVTGEYAFESAPSTSSSFDYDYLDYQPSFQEIFNKIPAIVDFVVPIQENDAVAAAGETMVGDLVQDYNFSLLLRGAASDMTIGSYTNPHDNSRVQSYYPVRETDGTSFMGAIAGMRASLGISTSAIRAELDGVLRPRHRLNESEMVSILQNNVNPVGYRNGGARTIDDLTTVTDTNSDEASFDTGFVRMVMDTVIEVVVRNEDQFIGKLNTESTRNNLAAVVKANLQTLKRSDAVEQYSVEARERTARTCELEINIETVKGLRNIYNTITAGERLQFDSSANDEQSDETQENTETATTESG